jgi:hypothetical protein
MRTRIKTNETKIAYRKFQGEILITEKENKKTILENMLNNPPF